MNRQPHPTSTASPPARNQRRRLWRWLLVIAALVSLIVFLPQFLLIQWGPRLLGTVLSKQLHTSVTVESLAGGWLNGLEVRGIEVAERPESSAPRLLRLERLTLNLAVVWLLVSSEPVVLRLEDLTVNLRRSDDGQWNMAALLAHLNQPTPGTAPHPAQPPSLPDRRVDVTLTGGRLHMEDDGTTYGFDLHAESASLAAAPWQGHFALSGPAGAALTVDGELQHLASSEPLAGHIEVNVSQLDVGVVTSLLPLPAAVQFHGRVPNAHARLVFAGTDGVTIAADLEFQQLQWQVASERATDEIEGLQIHLQGQWQDNQWSCDTLTIEAPHGRFALLDRAWMQADEDAWRGHAAFVLDVQDSQLATQALQTLLPPALHIQGPLQITGKADGAVSRDAQQPWEARVTGLEASLEASFAQITWRQEAFTEIITKAFLKEGLITIPQVSAKAFGSDIVLKGDLPLAENAPGGGIDWHLTNLPLHKILGKPLQRFVISQFSGRLTRHGKGYRVQSVVQFPELRLDPAELDQREFRITQAVFQCTATLSLPLTHLAFDGCSIASPEMRLTFHNGTLALGGQPQISLQLRGDLSGAFVNALVPEVPVQFTHSLHVSGPYSIRLQGNVWVGMQWDLEVTSDRFVFADMSFTDLGTRVVKAIGRLDIADVKAQRGQGHVEGAGAWHFVQRGQPAEGDLRLHLHQLPMQQVLGQDTPDGPYIIEGTVDGPTAVQTGRTGWQLTMDEQLYMLRLRHGQTTLAELSAARLRGLFGREDHGPLWARELELLGDELKIAVHHGRLPIQVRAQSAFEVDAAVEAQAPWVKAVLALLQVKGVEVGGRTQAVVRVQGKMQEPFQTLQGGGSVQMAQVGFLRQTFRAVDVAYDLVAGRLQITKGVLGYEDGRFDIQGSLGLPPRLGTPGDQGVVTLHQIPLEHTQQMQDFHSQGAATMHLRTTCNGEAKLQVTPSGQLQGGIQVQVDEIARQVRQGDRVLEAVEVPPVLLTSQVSSTRPYEHWEIPSLHLQGQGTTVALTNVHLHRTPSDIDIRGVLQAHLSSAVSYGVTMGFLPAAFEVKDTVDLEGTAGLRIPVTSQIEPRHLSYAGDVRLQSLDIEGDKAEGLTARLKLAQGRLTVETARAGLLNGEVRIPSVSFVDLQGPGHDFDVHIMAKDLQLQVHGGERLALSRMLFLLAPLFIIEPKRNEPASMTGTLEAELAVSGRFSDAPGWSKTVNGEGFFRIVDGAIQGSTLVAGLTTRVVMLPWNAVHDTLTGLFAADGRFGSALVSLGKTAFTFGTIESPIQVQAGEVHLKPNFEVRSPWFGMVINGSSTLEGDVNYRVRTDLIERLRFGSVTSLPDRIPIIGPVLREINPFRLLEGIELEATVQGNAFRKNAEGKIDIEVHTSILH
jgi:hypothetical protein